MPEGPELKYLQEKLKDKILRKKIYKIESINTKEVRLYGDNHYVRDIIRIGKEIWIETTQDRFIHIHLMLTGWLSFEKTEYPKYVFYFNGFKLYFDSKRKLSKLRILNNEEFEEEKSSLGVDIFSKEFTLNKFRQLIGSTDRMIVTFLLDQENVAGVGNYIKSEVLYIAGIDPDHNTSDLSEKDVKKLYEAIKHVAYSVLIDLLKSNKVKIPKDIKDRKPDGLQVPYNFKVYGQDRDPKGNKVTKEEIGGRKTYYVKKIQK